MFLFERLIGIGCYLLALCIIEFLILRTDLKLSRVFTVYLILLCTMALLYYPYQTADLYRILNMISYFGQLKWDVFWENHVIDSLSPSATILYGILGHMGLENWISGISCLLCYSIIFHIIQDVTKRYSLNRADVALVVVFVMSEGIFMPIISGIRMMIALCILLYCFYHIYFYRKFQIKHILLLTISLTFHTMAIIVIGIALIALILSGSIQKSKKIFIVVSLICVGIVIMLRGLNVVEMLMLKANYHILEDDYFELWEFILATISALLCLYIVFITLTDSHQRKSFFPIFVAGCLGVALIFITSFSIYHRLAVETAALMSIPLLSKALADKDNSKQSIVRKNLLIGGMILLFINVARGSLSSLKFFEW